jgi:DmsE family decaheme c-type cytochrome
MMKFLRVMLALCAFGVALGGSNAVSAADEAKPAAKKEAAKDLVLRGDAKCTTCHDEGDSPKVLSIGATRHGVKADGRTPSCTDCHGASDAHIKEAGRGGKKGAGPDVVFGGKAPSTAEARSQACLTCHEGDGKRMHWSGSQHESRDVACTSCHEMHVQHDKVMAKTTQPEVCFTCHKTERAQTHKVSTHPILAGKVACSDCHNPHGSTGPKLLVKNTVNETCYTCHAEKRGPFLYEHSPANDDCTNCHATHGSNNAALLKTRLPFLCQECHQDHGASLKSGASVVNATGGVLTSTTTATPITGTALGKSPSVQGNGRMCLNCHVMVHGSNAPSGAFLNR